MVRPARAEVGCKNSGSTWVQSVALWNFAFWLRAED